jgi:peptide/nickel transport system permease protein
VQFYGRYLAGAVRGDFGISTSLQQPVGMLIAARAPATFQLIAYGLLGGWIGGLCLGFAAALRPLSPVPLFTELLSSFFLCFPAAVLALMLFLAGGPASAVIAAAVFPKVYSYSRTLLAESLALPQVLAATARGISRTRILALYVIPPAITPMVALMGVSLTIAFGAAIPVEVICDIPGLGQLAWKAAIARDLPLLAAMTLIVTGMTLTANSAAGVAK